MKSNQYGQIVITENEAFTALLEGKITNLDSVYLDSVEAIEQYNRSRAANADNISVLEKLPELNLSTEEFDKLNQENWFMPENYFPNLLEWLFEQCSTQEEKDRVATELELYAQYRMIPVLHYIKYLVDIMRKEGIVWGVGRGSSVASYVLYLIGAHKVNSLKYNLDIREFLK